MASSPRRNGAPQAVRECERSKNLSGGDGESKAGWGLGAGHQPAENLAMSRIVTLSPATARLRDARMARNGFADADAAISAALQDEPTLAPWMIDEIDAALAEDRANPGAGLSPDQARAELRGHIGVRLADRP
jgi:hypothetical protein